MPTFKLNPAVDPFAADSTKDLSCPWSHGALRTIGSEHLRRQIPCQDAALAETNSRPFAVVCDGRGSAKLSHHGSLAGVTAIKRAVRVLEPMIADCLDCAESSTAADAWDRLAVVLLRWLMDEQLALAKTHTCPPEQFDFTLAAIIVGSKHVGWVQVGDSCLAVQRSSTVSLVAKPQRGEWAGQTEFVRPSSRTSAVALRGLIPASGVTGLVAFSDGVAAKLVNALTEEPAPGIGQILDRLASASWSDEQLQAYLEKPFWLEGGDDDRSIAYLVKTPTDIVPILDEGPVQSSDLRPAAATATSPGEFPFADGITEPWQNQKARMKSKKRKAR